MHLNSRYASELSIPRSLSVYQNQNLPNFLSFGAPPTHLRSAGSSVIIYAQCLAVKKGTSSGIVK